MAEHSQNFFRRTRLRTAFIVFGALCITLPAYLFSNLDKLVKVKDKTFLEWVADNGWWGKAGMKFVGLWLLTSAAIALAVYGLYSLTSWLIERGKNRRTTLTVTFEDRPPYTDDSGPSPLGFYYRNRRIGITNSVDGAVTVKVPEVTLANGQIRSNIFLRPTDNQPEEVDAGDPGYWRVVQWNTSEKSIKLVHKGRDSYYLGSQNQFDIVVKCAGTIVRKTVTVKLDGKELLLQLDDVGKAPALSTSPVTPIESYDEGEESESKLAGKIICINTDITVNYETEPAGLDCFFTMFVNVWNDAATTTITGFRFEVIWDGTDYPTIRKTGLEKYRVKYTLPSDKPQESKYETTYKPLFDFPSDFEITNTNNCRGWLRFFVRRISLEAGSKTRIRLHDNAVMRLLALDRKGKPHVIYEGKPPRSGCGPIEERPVWMRFEKDKDGSLAIKTERE